MDVENTELLLGMLGEWVVETQLMESRELNGSLPSLVVENRKYVCIQEWKTTRIFNHLQIHVSKKQLEKNYILQEESS